MLRIIKKIFIVILTSMVNASNYTKCISLSNQKCEIQPTLITLYLNEYIQELHYYPFAVKLDKCDRSWMTLNDFSNKVCVLNKTEDLKIHVFNIYTGKTESKILTKDASDKGKQKFDGRKFNSNQKWKNNKCQWECKKHIICEKEFGILLHVVVKMENI